MLKFLSKRRRSQSILLYGLIGLMCIGLLIFFTGVVTGNKTILGNAANNDTTVAKVGSYKITVQDMRSQLTAFSRQMSGGGPMQGGELDDVDNTYSLYGSQVLNSLIRSRVVLYEADQLGLTASDAEVQTRLGEMFNPWPGYEQYKSMLLRQGYSVDQFEEGLRTEISQQKLRSYITAAVQVSPQEVEDEYRKNNTSYDVRYVEVDPEKFKDKVQISDADLQNYFNEHKQDFRVNGEERKAKYIFVDQNKAGETIQVSDDELKKEFNPERGVKQVRVSEIVVNVPKESSDKTTTADEEARKKAQSLVDQAKGAPGKPAGDFATLARENSDDSKNKSKGGDIGWVNKDDKRDADDPLNRVFTMKPGDVSPPVKKDDKYYVLKVTDRKVPTFAESRDQLLKEVRATKAYSKAVDISTEAEKKFKESKNAESVVADLNKVYGGEIAVVKQTPFFAQGDKLPDIGTATDMEEGVFKLSATGEVGDRVNVQGGFAVPQYEANLGPHDPAFDEVKSKVEDQYRASKAKELAKQKADELAKAGSTDALKSAAEAAGLKAEDKPGINGNDAIGPLMSDASRQSVYKLSAGQVTPAAIKEENGDSYVVVGLLNRKDADMGEAFQKQRQSLETQLLQTKGDTLFDTFLESTQKRLKDEGKVKIY
ncbi:MAG: SurA N-terminal domain-containing protein, partial [Blastocatellia bacterium]